jgi:hypothetical protein
MYFIIEKEDQLSKLSTEGDCFIQVIPLNSNIHPTLSEVSLIYYKVVSKGYIIVLDHSEGFSLNKTVVSDFLKKHSKIYVLDAKFHSYFFDLDTYVDLNYIQLDKSNKLEAFECDTNLHKDYYHRFQNSDTPNSIIPIVKHYQKCECLYDMASVYMGLEMDVEGQKRQIKAYKKVEECGMRVDKEMLLKTFQLKNENYSIKGDTVYTSYNLYNLTSRPTNAFNGINFLAIPKDEEHRACFLPKNDYFVDFDFDGYHLRLIAKLINYTFPNQPVHEFLGQQYFKKDKLIEQEYSDSKKISFRQLYGGVEAKYKGIDFFKHLDKFIESKWHLYKTSGYAILPTGRLLRYTEGMTGTKLFNYFIQNMETKENVDKLNQIHDLIEREGYKSQVVLVTYDSILLDYCLEDGKSALLQIKQILEQGGMVVKHKYGKTYYFG